MYSENFSEAGHRRFLPLSVFSAEQPRRIARLSEKKPAAEAEQLEFSGNGFSL